MKLASRSVLIKSICVAFTAFEVWAITLAAVDPWIHRVVFLAFILPMIFLGDKSVREDGDLLNIVLSVVTVASCIYLLIEGDRFITRWPMVSPLSITDILVGLLIMATTLWLTWKIFGWILTAIVAFFVAYSFLGPFLPGLLYHQGMSLKGFIDQNVYTISGLMGLPLGVATTYIFAFVTFGSFFHAAGGGDFIFRLANAIAGRAVGGPAKVAIVASGLYGMISGSAVSDAATTGSFTIPMMKRMGFSPTFAAAVEAVASTGGGVLPPVMGSVAFLMAEFTGIPYVRIAAASAIPALLYYVGLYWQVHYHSVRLGVGRTHDSIPAESLGTLFRSSSQYLLPLIVLIWLLVVGMPPELTAVISSGVAILVSWTKRETRMGPRKILEAIVTCSQRVAGVGCVCAAAGLVIGGVTFTGLGGKMLSLILTISSGSLLIALVTTAVVTVVIGMGIPVVPAYAITSVLAAPALKELGLSVMIAHLFVLYFANMSAITPPIAVAAYVTAGLAEADPTRVGFLSMRLGFVTFIVPFLFAFQQVLTLQGPLLDLCLAVPTAFLGVWAMAKGIEGWPTAPGRGRQWQRVPLFVGGLLLIYPGIVTDTVAVVLLLLMRGTTYLQERDAKRRHLEGLV